MTFSSAQLMLIIQSRIIFYCLWVCQLFLYEYIMDINMDQTCKHDILKTNEPILMSRFTEQEPETIWGS